MLQGYTMAIVPCGNPTPKKLHTGGGEWPTFRTARAQRTVCPHITDKREKNSHYTGVFCSRVVTAGVVTKSVDHSQQQPVVT